MDSRCNCWIRIPSYIHLTWENFLLVVFYMNNPLKDQSWSFLKMVPLRTRLSILFLFQAYINVLVVWLSKFLMCYFLKWSVLILISDILFNILCWLLLWCIYHLNLTNFKLLLSAIKLRSTDSISAIDLGTLRGIWLVNAEDWLIGSCSILLLTELLCLWIAGPWA